MNEQELEAFKRRVRDEIRTELGARSFNEREVARNDDAVALLHQIRRLIDACVPCWADSPQSRKGA